MPENVTAQRKITFKTGLPLGRHAIFTHEGQQWVALPRDKYVAIVTVTDRLIGALRNIHGQMIRWLSAKPEDADRVAMLLTTIARADEIASSAAVDKVKAQTA